MKKVLFLMAAVALLCVSCVKEKNCRCSILGHQEVRIVTIKSGDCAKINSVGYFDPLDTLHTEFVVCTDFPFSGDSIIVNQ